MVAQQFAFLSAVDKDRPFPALDSSSPKQILDREGGLQLKEFVSNHWTSVVTVVASMSVICVIFVPYGFPWTGLAWSSFALLAAALMAMRSTRSIRQVIDDIETEPRPAAAAPERVAVLGGARLRLEGEGTP